MPCSRQALSVALATFCSYALPAMRFSTSGSVKHWLPHLRGLAPIWSHLVGQYSYLRSPIDYLTSQQVIQQGMQAGRDRLRPPSLGGGPECPLSAWNHGGPLIVNKGPEIVL